MWLIELFDDDGERLGIFAFDTSLVYEVFKRIEERNIATSGSIIMPNMAFDTSFHIERILGEIERVVEKNKEYRKDETDSEYD